MNEQVQVEIIGMAITARYGTLTTGSILRTDAAFAKHLVEECGAAKYVEAPAVVEAPEAVEAPAVVEAPEAGKKRKPR